MFLAVVYQKTIKVYVKIHIVKVIKSAFLDSVFIILLEKMFNLVKILIVLTHKFVLKGFAKI